MRYAKKEFSGNNVQTAYSRLTHLLPDRPGRSFSVKRAYLNGTGTGPYYVRQSVEPTSTADRE
jgi:hypothetical protein